MKSTKVQTLGADYAIEHLTLHETLDKVNGQDITHVDLIAQWITLYIRNYKLTKLHCHILVLFVLKSHNYFRRKVKKKVLH